MTADFLSSFETILVAVGKLFAVAALGAALFRLGIVRERQIDAAVKIVVAFLLPCLILAKFFGQFRPADIAGWWMLPVAAAAMLWGTALFSWCVTGLGHWSDPARRRLTAAMCAFQNAGYVPLPLVMHLFPDETRAHVILCLFIFIPGNNTFLWSIVPPFIGNRTGSAGWRRLLNPPLIAIALGALAVGIGWRPNEGVVEIMDVFGNAAPWLIMLTLGCILGSLRPEGKFPVKIVLLVVATKLLLVPLAMLAFLMAWDGPENFRHVLMIEAVSPPATAFLLIARRYATAKIADLAARVVLASYLVSVLTIPIFMALYGCIFS